MKTYLFVTKPEFKPERVEKGVNVPWWSCSSDTARGDHAFVYVTGIGIQYEWRILSKAVPDAKWKKICKVKHVRTFDSPISIREIRNSFTQEEWAPPHQNFRGLRSIKVPDEIVLRLQALRPDSIRKSDEFLFPEEVPPGSTPIKGAVRQITVNAYERNPEARRQCLNRYGTACSVCGIDFGKVYGPLAEGFIHVHHLTPLHELGAEYEVDPVVDMRPVCPNCHAVIHLKGNLHSLEEVREFLIASKCRTEPCA